MAVDWSADGVLMWKEEAVKEQQVYCDTLGTPRWRKFEPSNYVELKRKIGFALFGVPQEVPCTSLNENTGYTQNKLKHINKIFDIIKKCMQHHINPNNILVSFLFVFGKTSDGRITAPIIRIPQFGTTFKQSIYYFIDSSGRVYENWKDYLDNNTLPECVLCYPTNGLYSAAVNGAVDVEFGISPAGRTAAKVLKGFDIGGTVLNMGAAGTLIAGLIIPVAVPVVASAVGVSVATSLYEAGRGIQNLADRGQHQQSIGLDSPESRSCWLGIVGGMLSIVSVGAMAATAKTAQAFATTSSAKRTAIKSVAFGPSFFNSLALGNGVANIIDKMNNGEEINHLELFQITTAFLFFTHSVISTRQAMSVLNSMGKNSSEVSTGGTKALMNGISKTVGSTETCNGVPRVNFVCSSTVWTIEKRNVLPLSSVCCEVGRKLMEIAKGLLGVVKNMCNWVLEVGGVLLVEFWKSFVKEIAEVVDTICRAFGVKHWSELAIKGCRLYIESGDIRTMATTLISERMSLVDGGSIAMTSHQGQADSISAVVDTDNGPNSSVGTETPTGVRYYDEVTNILAKSVDRQMCRNPEDLKKYMTFICKFVRRELQKKKSNYDKTWEMVKDVKNVEDFKKQYGISGNPDNHFLQDVFDEFRNEEQDAFTFLQMTYMKQNAGTSAQEDERGQSFLDTEGVRFSPFYSMCGTASNGMLSEQQYREMAAKLTGSNADSHSIHISASGDTAVIQATDVVVVQCWLEDGKVSGVAAVLRTSSD